MSAELPKYTLLDSKTTEKMLQDFTGERTGWVQIGEEKWLFPYQYTKQGEGFFKFEARSTDVWVMSYPRSGTTWTQELVWLIANNMDFKTANSRSLTERFPFLEFSMFNHPDVTKELLVHNKDDLNKQNLCKAVAVPGYEVLDKMPSPRFIKSHFPFSLVPNLLNSGCKIVYVARNPKDVAVSWFKLNQDFVTQGYQGDFPLFWQYFRNNLTPWSPYWKHLKEAWSNRKNCNLLFIFYEELQQNLQDVAERVANFLGKSYTQDQMAQLENHLCIKNFKNNPMVNLQEFKELGIIKKSSEFVRNGKTGGWKDYFDEKLEADANEWIAKNLEDTDLTFPLANNNFI